MDSAPGIGSIGRAAEIGLADGGWAPMILAAPALGRWQAFGNLFARAPQGVARLDRHPTMRHHPVTPMDEADVRRHIARQTDLAIDMVDCVALGADQGAARLAEVVAAGARIVAIDVMDDTTLAAAGQLLWQAAEAAALFVLGSQGVEYALVAARPRAAKVTLADRVTQIVAISGSASPDTARQITLAEAQGFTGIRVDARAALDPRGWNAEAKRATRLALDVLARGGSPILFTAIGPDDPVLASVADARTSAGIAADDANRQL
ncbi:MAG: four-carbon acid sugar kinase family protein, partial [Pseudomonadota bacterium]